MSLDIAVHTALVNAGVANPGRGWKSESQAMPCAIVRYIADTPLNSLKGEMSMQNQYIAIDCWADDLESAESLRDQVIASMAASNLTAIRKATRPLHEPKTTTFRFTIEYSVWG